MIIRDAQPTDTRAVTRLLSQLGYAVDETEASKRLEQISATAGHRIVIAEAVGRVVGLLHVFERPALEKACEAVVQSLVVDSEFRGTGIGEALMREAEAWATQRGLASTVLYTRIDRDKSRAFYERIGYRLKATSHLMGRSQSPDGPT
jgi:ribosomal protein S18 acetylase RimI-like enzyme